MFQQSGEGASPLSVDYVGTIDEMEEDRIKRGLAMSPQESRKKPVQMNMRRDVPALARQFQSYVSSFEEASTQKISAF